MTPNVYNSSNFCYQRCAWLWYDQQFVNIPIYQRHNMSEGVWSIWSVLFIQREEMMPWYKRACEIRWMRMRRDMVTWDAMWSYEMNCGRMRWIVVTWDEMWSHEIRCGHMRWHVFTCDDSSMRWSPMRWDNSMRRGKVVIRDGPSYELWSHEMRCGHMRWQVFTCDDSSMRWSHEMRWVHEMRWPHEMITWDEMSWPCVLSYLGGSDVASTKSVRIVSSSNSVHWLCWWKVTWCVTS